MAFSPDGVDAFLVRDVPGEPWGFDADTFWRRRPMGSGTVHGLDRGREFRGAADGLIVGLIRTKHEWVVWVHADVYLPNGWDWGAGESNPRG